jgi:CheY-like chemotaxis protein
VSVAATLLVEDNEDDAFIFRRMWRKAQLPDPVLHVADGQSAIDYLSGEGEYHDRKRFPLPEVIFLDLKLPGKHGFEVLEWIRTQSELKHTCVVILTSSGEERDLNRAFLLKADAYLVKPPSTQDLENTLKALSRDASHCGNSNSLKIAGAHISELDRLPRSRN